MTSGVFHHVPTSSITIDRDRRQRREVTNVEELAESIHRIGLINPIVVTRELVLVAGERRLTAIRALGWDSIPCQYTDELDEAELHAIELEENIKRIDLSWQDQIKALQDYHTLRKAQDPGWTQSDTGKALGIKQHTVSEQLSVAKEMHNPRVAEAPKYSVAKGIVSRDNERKSDAAVLKFKEAISAPADAPKAVEPDRILNVSFLEWAPAYTGPRFNLLHCDFPYGIDADKFAQGAAAAHGGYSDSEENYWTLCQCLTDNLDRIATESCHLMFWFSMKFYSQTRAFLERNSDFVFDEFPLMWMKSDNVGILPDPSRGPRRIYETAFLARRGDRKVVQAVANAYSGPSVRNTHMSEKPEPMLRHFFRMLVDNNSLVLDPTAGSGSSIRAALAGGAAHAVGLEINPEFAERANLELRKKSNVG